MVEFEDEVVDLLTKKGFSEKWGGRQVDRVIQEMIMNVLAKKMLKKELRKKQKMMRSEEHTYELQSPDQIVCRLLLEKKKNQQQSFNSFRKLAKHVLQGFTSLRMYMLHA